MRRCQKLQVPGQSNLSRGAKVRKILASPGNLKEEAPGGWSTVQEKKRG